MAQTMCGLAFTLPSPSLRLILISRPPPSRGGKAYSSRWQRETRKYTPRPFLFRLAGWWIAGSSNGGGRAAAPALDWGAGLSSRLPTAAGGGGSARGLLAQGWPSLFDKLIVRRGLADPGVTPVTTKVELEEIRLKERKKKKLKGELAGDWRQRPRGDARSSVPGSHFPLSSSFALTRRDLAINPHPGRGLVTEAGEEGIGRSAAF